jgi:hypothetical protein
MKSTRWLLAVSMMALFAGCASRSTFVSESPRVDTSNAHEQIEQLATAIRSALPEAGVDPNDGLPPLLHGDFNTSQPMASQSGAAACSNNVAALPRCSKSCEVTQSICKNADQICKLADDLGANLGRDDWAKQKCVDGTKACQASQARCCSCSSSSELKTGIAP